MINQIFPEKPTVFSGLLVLLSLAITSCISLLADAQKNILITENTLIIAVGGILSIFLGMATYIYSLSQKLKKFKARKERIEFWRKAINNVDSYSSFHNCQTQVELNNLLTKDEQVKLKESHSDNSIHINIGVTGEYSESLEDRLFKFYQEVVNRIEREWGII